jgi:hypothetical protein
MHFEITVSLNTLDNSAGIATNYRLEGRGSIPGRGKRFPLFHSVQTGSGPTQHPIQWVQEAL